MSNTDFQEVNLNDFISEEDLSIPQTDGEEEVSLNEFLVEGDTSFRPDEELQADKPFALQPTDELKNEIASFYLNEHLVEALINHGSIPKTPVETSIGVGFVDIVEYSYLSSWMSPKENQIFLNGLYTAFHSVLKRHGGFLNKISGDSIMFNIGGNIDPAIKGMSKQDSVHYIAETLLYTCIEIQKTCRLFNKADKAFLSRYSDEKSRDALRKAFLIIQNLRENLSMVTGINAMFQVKVRIGACLGEVCIGNFGPHGASQWDVIGQPVIEARRMESTAPVDGLRISKSLYDTLKKAGITDKYYKEFTQEAQSQNGYYANIKEEELFNAKKVILQDKKNVDFDSYAVQTNPMLPEDINHHVESYLTQHDEGADKIIEILQFHRGNRLVIHAIEELFREHNIQLRKAKLYEKLHPRRYSTLLNSVHGNLSTLSRLIDKKIPLYLIFRILGHYQDSMNSQISTQAEAVSFNSFDDYLKSVEENLHEQYKRRKKIRERFLYFNNVLFPFVFAHIRACILEYQNLHTEKREMAESLG